MSTLKIGTRKSKLALAQSEWVKNKIESRHPGMKVELVKITTTGDRILDSPLSKIGGKGLFVKEIEEALFSGKIDLAVHSMKDVPAELPEGLMLSTFPQREIPFDALISSGNRTLQELPEGARLGTSSLRRAAQLLYARPDLNIMPLRGNVDTRLRKLDSGELDSIVLAAAGLKRLSNFERTSQLLEPEVVLPAIGQGALGIEVRSGDRETIETMDFLNHRETEISVKAERAFLKRLEGGCQVPIGGYATLNGNNIRLDGLVSEIDGSRIIRDFMTGPSEDAEEIGRKLAERVLEAGADRILEGIYGGS